MIWYFDTLINNLNYHGRTERFTFWTFLLVSFVFVVFLAGIDRLTGLEWGSCGFGILSSLYLLLIIIPSFSITIRRLHDCGYSGWYIIMLLIPPLLFLLLFILCHKGLRGYNEYGPSLINRR
ncbi:DUF805 domain-containing protein [Citrobacter amalonaticus]|uniref:DUF805 domain-containing protein n=1 Tax=Citrobacter amalonaticus TaxID=35703 RepID=UPI001A2CC757|nr:DUF805 domain-containing protein [Citrobacter amalonaticus]HDQ2813314.1 DUF805 domain-containing protein [Citrobacter amalonaticus]